MDTAGRIWEGDSVQLATKEVRLTLILWTHGAGGSPKGGPGELWLLANTSESDLLRAGRVGIGEADGRVPVPNRGRRKCHMDDTVRSGR